jgi:hypothetical protein
LILRLSCNSHALASDASSACEGGRTGWLTAFLILEPVSGSPFVRALADELSNGHDARFYERLIVFYVTSDRRSRSKLRFDNLVVDDGSSRLRARAGGHRFEAAGRALPVRAEPYVAQGQEPGVRAAMTRCVVSAACTGVRGTTIPKRLSESSRCASGRRWPSWECASTPITDGR